MEQMTDKKQLGNQGEEAAARYLEQQGYHILERNWYCRGGELDIVATRGEIIAFVEVKTRRPGALVTPLEAVNYRKQQRVILAANAYLCCHSVALQPRFDVAAVTARGGSLTVAYWEAAFDATGHW